MNFQYVDQAPLQTQSWLVAVGQILGPESFLLRFSTDLVLLAAAVISVFAAWRGANLYLMGLMITLAFLILSKKVVGYYYVMLLPFALVYLVPARRFDLLAIIVAVTSWISISPYFASWTASEHWWVYAVLGILNTMVWLALFVWLWRGGASIAPTANGSESKMAVLVFLTAGLFSEWVAASIVQPMVNSSTSPIRPPLISPGFEQNALLALLLFVLLVLFSLVLMTASVRRWGGAISIPRRVVALLLAFAPLPFMTFALTKESTTALEWLLRAAGM